MKDFRQDYPLKFRDWLLKVQGMQENTADSRVSNINTINNEYGALDYIDRQWAVDKCEYLLQQFAYSRKDEENNKAPLHKIPINGNIYNGTATYRAAIRLYCKYLNYTASPFAYISNAIVQELKKFKAEHALRNNYTTNDVKSLIQIPLYKQLQRSVLNDIYDFAPEAYPKSLANTQIANSIGDQIDIAGKPKRNKLPLIVIEIDTHRVDQITKKVVSRLAATSNQELIYVTLLYPNTHESRKAELAECEKYHKMVDELFGMLKTPHKKNVWFELYDR